AREAPGRPLAACPAARPSAALWPGCRCPAPARSAAMGAASAHACYCEESEFHTKYTLGKMLGKGSQGKVYVCMSKETGHTRAVKIIDRSWRTAWATYRREVELCKAASASNVIEVLEEFVDSAYCYVVMEKFEGHLRKGMKWVAKE
ncbi:unnamed protein product, partial [Prorocentrum cordatum]